MLIMPTSVTGSFNAFRENVIDLDPGQTQRARASRDYLCEQLKGLQNWDSSFPTLTGDFHPFGSFARGTKTRPLNDIDLLVVLNGRGTTSKQPSSSDPYEYWLHISEDTAPLAKFPDAHGYVNSTKILNKIKSSLGTIANYEQAEINKRQQAVRFKLKSYSWVFDIVPAVGISNGSSPGTHYYLIPDGSGDWIRTDPRIDRNNITQAVARHGSLFRPLMRLLKYWNRRAGKPTLSSYYFETLVLKVFEHAPVVETLPKAINYFFNNCYGYLMNTCPDPKGLGPALDRNIDADTKNKVSSAMLDGNVRSQLALQKAAEGNVKEAIEWWGRLFGPEFPAYG